MGLKTPPETSDKLRDYRSKRDPKATPEPFGGGGRRGLFVVQMHAARRLHYDFRLEYDGVLFSWSVPMGPSYDPKVKRLAVRTEEHPLDYSDFEGVIPAGNYGAGSVIVWEQGRWLLEEDGFLDALAAGKLTFSLYGHKLRGRWGLIQTKQNWLLVKKNDAWANFEPPDMDRSIFSGATVEQVGQPWLSPVTLPAEKSKLKAPWKPMLAVRNDTPVAQAGWLHEVKYDGYRVMAQKKDGSARLFYRSGRECTNVFPEVCAALAAWRGGDVAVDGEVVVLGSDANPNFSKMAQRAQRGSGARVELPAVYYVFDILTVEGRDLRKVELRQRKEILRSLSPDVGVVRFSQHIEGEARAFFTAAIDSGLEGIVSKKANSVYVEQRHDTWIKTKNYERERFYVGGIMRRKDHPEDLAGLVLFELVEKKRWEYRGRVGTGWDQMTRQHLLQTFSAQNGIPEPAAETDLTLEEKQRCLFFYPERQVEVQYPQVTEKGLPKHMSFVCLVDEAKRQRDDRAVDLDRRVRIARPEKLIFPEVGVTKAQVWQHYKTCFDAMRPFLVDRPIAFERFPDGIHGNSFYQKSAPDWFASWVRREPIWSESTHKNVDYVVIDDVDSLKYICNLGTVTLHLWHSRSTKTELPDWCLIDLDPLDVPFKEVIKVAMAFKRLFDALEIYSVIKTTGSKGFHILLPLDGTVDYKQCRQFAALLTHAIMPELPLVTLERLKASRRGRVYVDTLQNRRAYMLVAPYALRSTLQASVSCPVPWDLVPKLKDARQFRVGDAFPEVDWSPFFSQPIDLRRTLERLQPMLRA